jgi:hypothetical protein
MKKLLLLGLLFASNAQAFTLFYQVSRSLTTIGWKTNNVTFDVDTSCASFMDDVTSSVGSAIEVWNNVPTSALVLSLGGSYTLSGALNTYVGTTATNSAPARNPIIYCDTAFQANAGVSADSIPGYAAAQNMTASGQLQGGLLVLNFQTGARANVRTLGSTSASIILAHEMGHVLGFGHSSDTNALMYYSTGPSRSLVLGQDDINVLSYLYPRQEPGQGGFLGCGTVTTRRDFGSGGSGSGSGAAELGLWFALILAIRHFRPALRWAA